MSAWEVFSTALIALGMGLYVFAAFHAVHHKTPPIFVKRWLLVCVGSAIAIICALVSLLIL